MYASYLQTEEAHDQERLVAGPDEAPATHGARNIRLVIAIGSVAFMAFAAVATFSHKKDHGGMMLGRTDDVSGLYCGYSAGSQAGQYTCDQRVAFEITDNGLSLLEAKTKIHNEFYWACPGCDVTPPTPAPVPAALPVQGVVTTNATNSTLALAASLPAAATVTTLPPAVATVASGVATAVGSTTLPAAVATAVSAVATAAGSTTLPAAVATAVNTISSVATTSAAPATQAQLLSIPR